MSAGQIAVLKRLAMNIEQSRQVTHHLNPHPAIVEVRGAGPDLVLCHGWAMHSGIWGRALDLLAEHFCLHLIDLPGHGRNRSQPWPSDWRSWVDELVGQLPTGAAWMGWSLGGLVALDAAQRHGDHISRLILVASNPCFVAHPQWPHAMAETLFQQFADDLADDYPVALNRFLALEVHGSDNARQALRELRECAYVHGMPDTHALSGGLAWLREANLTAGLTNTQTPTLVVGGDRDRLVPPEAIKATMAAMPNAGMSVIKGAGHAPFIGHRDEFVQRVVDFMR